MNKAELIKSVSKSCGMTQEITKSVLESYLKIMKEKLSNEEKITIKGFGVFYVKLYEEKIARNISQNNLIKVPKQKKVKFKAGQELLDLINSK